MKIEFTIKHKWLNENNIDKETIMLMRSYNDEWQELTTTYLSKDSTYAYFEAETTGLSTFAITGEKSLESPRMPWIIVIIGIISAIAILFIVFFKKGYFHSDKKNP